MAIFFSFHSVKTGSGALPASNPVGTGDDFLEEATFVGQRLGKHVPTAIYIYIYIYIYI
jgi:hypothetical protein